MSRAKFVAGNWKMNVLLEPAVNALTELGKLTADATAEVVVCPTYVYLQAAVRATQGTKVSIGAQDAFWMASGAFTSRISAEMLKDLGVQYCIVGHSETRGKFGKLEVPSNTVSYFAETDETVNLKIGALLKNGIVPILCVGETAAERDAEETDQVIQSQLELGLSGFTAGQLAPLVVAYEPVWAIGTGNTCDAAEAGRVCGMIRSCLSDLFGESFASGCRVLYGGSVKASNAAELFAQPDIDGGLVGGASIDPNEFARIVHSA